MQIVLNIPDNVQLSEFDLKMYIGVSLYEKDIMSTGLAASVVGINRGTFIENMGKYGMSIFEKLTVEDIQEDAKVADHFIAPRTLTRQEIESLRQDKKELSEFAEKWFRENPLPSMSQNK